MLFSCILQWSSFFLFFWDPCATKKTLNDHAKSRIIYPLGDSTPRNAESHNTKFLQPLRSQSHFLSTHIKKPTYVLHTGRNSKHEGEFNTRGFLQSRSNTTCVYAHWETARLAHTGRRPLKMRITRSFKCGLCIHNDEKPNITPIQGHGKWWALICKCGTYIDKSKYTLPI